VPTLTVVAHRLQPEVAAIGARRTQTAYHRLLAATAAADVEVEVGGFTEEDPGFIDKLRGLSQVADMGLESIAPIAPDMPGDPPEFSPLTRFVGVMSVDGRAGWTVNRPLLLAGRRPDHGRPDEVGLSESLARRWAVEPGDTIRLRALTPPQLLQALAGERVIPTGPALALGVVAVQRLSDDLAVDTQAVEGFVSLTPAFYRAYQSRIAHFPPQPHVRLERGQADVAAFTDAARRLAHNSPEVSVVSRADLALRVDQATRIQVVALVLFAVLAAGAALVVIGQSLTRELLLATSGQETLRALGASPQQLFAATTLPIGLASALGGVLGAGIAVLASPLMPIGLARRAEPTPGLAVHLTRIGIGVALTVVLLAGWVALPAWRLARASRDAPEAAGRVGATSRLADAAAQLGLPPSSVAGLRMALEQGRGGTAVPVRTTLVGVTAGIVALTAALIFAASLTRLLEVPRLYGWDFDVIAGGWELDDQASRRPPWLAANPHVGAFSAVYFYAVVVEGAEEYAAGIDTAHGQVFPTMVQGRAPNGPDEIALGTRTLRQLGRRVGQTVQVAGGRSVAMRIVGRSAFLAGDAETPPPGPSSPWRGCGGCTPTRDPAMASSTSATRPAPTARRPCEAFSGQAPASSKTSSFPGHRSTSRTSVGSATCPTCSLACWRCWRSPPSAISWSRRSAGAAATWPF
jgi:hypothetical protein